jgi:hypothetical protein
MKQHPRYGFRLGLAAFAVAAATLIAGESRADIDLGQGIVLAPGAQIPVPPGVTSDPITLTVNCSSGGTVAQALSLRPLSNTRFTIIINGTCTEAVNLGGNRGVTLQAGSSGGGLQAPSSSTDPVLAINGQNIVLDGLTISGGVHGIFAYHGAQFSGTNLVIQGASTANVELSGATADLTNATIQNSAADGLQAYWGATIFLNGGTVQNNAHWGVNIGNGSSLDLYGGGVISGNTSGGGFVTDAGSITLNNGAIQSNPGYGILTNNGGTARLNANGVVQSNGLDGVQVFGGSLQMSGGTIASNSRQGIFIFNSGTAILSGGAVVKSNVGHGIAVRDGTVNVGNTGGSATIQSNQANGLYLQANSVGYFNNSGNQIINNTGWGILCTGSPSNPLINGTIGTVSGNGSGQIACNTAPQPPGSISDSYRHPIELPPGAASGD